MMHNVVVFDNPMGKGRINSSKEYKMEDIQYLTLSTNVTSAPAFKSSSAASGLPSSQAQCKGLRRY